MNIPKFSGNRKEYDQHTYWMNVESGNVAPDEYQEKMMELIGQAEAEGIFYERDMREWMSEHTPFIPEAVLFMQFEQTPTKGGVFGMEVFLARSARRAIARRGKNMTAASMYRPGEVLGTLKVNGKKVTRATVERIEGEYVHFTATIGRYGCNVSTEAANIEPMKLRAIESGWRKA